MKAEDAERAEKKEQAKGKKHKKLLEQVDLFVMLALLGHRNNKTGQCDPSHEVIAAEIGVSASTVKRSFNRLIEAGFMGNQTINKQFLPNNGHQAGGFGGIGIHF